MDYRGLCRFLFCVKRNFAPLMETKKRKDENDIE